ncbi:restriction endonuclease subunit S, partial [Mycobacterium tuberculosis]
IGGVSIAKFIEIPIPLPPLEEQHRIVTKIDQLMARCDELESLRKTRDDMRLNIHTAALSKLLGASDGGSAKSAWTFVARHFEDL